MLSQCLQFCSKISQNSNIEQQQKQQMNHRHSVDSTGAMFFTKYSDPAQLNGKERKRFRSTFQASKLGDQNKMDQIQQMFNNYNLFKYGQYGGKKRKSLTSEIRVTDPLPSFNHREKAQDVKARLTLMAKKRHDEFEKLNIRLKKQ